MSKRKKGLAAMECKVAIGMMHDYFDGDLTKQGMMDLKGHMSTCPACLARFEQLEKTEAMTFSALEHAAVVPHYDIQSSEKLTQLILDQIPKPQAKTRPLYLRLLYKYPGVTVAAIFVLVMLGSFVSMWGHDTKLVVSGEDLHQVVIDGNTVTIPEGVHIKGNLIVENGMADVRGEIDGNVTVIDGSLNLASTGYIAGQSRTIDQALDWFWYKVTTTISGLAS
ncbi:zf-HC2 domain-containing protein [Paenibacillus sp. KS-LC4]|uniref:zf-HC2 domain-containing protein n=1 Tax=Paenibacillus sp. KS-LC4 TaxID=2979727 RepID=UPI0030CAF816